MEYVIVIYPTERLVYINDVQNGKTNKKLRIEEGTHKFDLGPRKDYEPESQTVTVTGTTVLDPMEITFTKES
ncbi:MAG: PEGA domain-containing protein [Woeseiaceae bacterium]|nr:PEGA domain-containing protein [Woeseiaceae bacterium]